MRAARWLAPWLVVLGLAGDAAAQGGPAWLGIAMDRAPAGGVLVTHVVAGSPAERAGLHEGERILGVDGAMATSPGWVQRSVSLHASGESVTLVVAGTDGKQRLVKVELASRPSTDQMLRMDHVGKFARPWSGLESVRGPLPKNVGALRGKVVVVDFWATWCGPCRLTAPVLNSWQARYGAQGLSVVGITTDAADEAASFAERHGMRFALASDPTGETSRTYGVVALPTLFVIDKRGVVRDIAIGYSPDREAEVESLIRSLLAEPSAVP